MRIIFILLFLCSNSSFAKTKSKVKSKTLSEFERRIINNNYQLPHPFKNLEVYLEESYLEQRGTIQAKTRALKQYMVSPKRPRTIIALTNDDPFDKPIQTFISHIKDDDMIEVISWNQESLRYEFLFVHDYAKGKKLRITRPDRATCIKCHHDQGPIFARAPWNETVDNPLVEKALLENNIKLKDNRLPAEDIDGFIRNSSSILNAYDIIQNACLDNLMCKKSFILLGFFDLRNFSDKQAQLIKEYTSSFLKKFKAAPTSVLPDLNQELTKVVLLRDTRSKKNNFDSTYEFPLDILDFLIKPFHELTYLDANDKKGPGSALFKRPLKNDHKKENYLYGLSGIITYYWNFKNTDLTQDEAFELLLKSSKLDKAIEKNYHSPVKMKAVIDLIK